MFLSVWQISFNLGQQQKFAWQMESDNVQSENELAEHTANGTEDIPLNQEHLKTTGM